MRQIHVRNDAKKPSTSWLVRENQQLKVRKIYARLSNKQKIDEGFCRKTKNEIKPLSQAYLKKETKDRKKRFSSQTSFIL